MDHTRAPHDLITAIRRGDGPAVSEALFGLADVQDTTGRPLGERRASSSAKAGCPMELVPCPYPDTRHGIAMNVSALEQVTGQLRVVHADVARFRSSLQRDLHPWIATLATVVDQLFAPGRALLAHEDATARPDAACAAGHKLAAGLFDAVVGVVNQLLRGERVPHDLDTFLAHIDETNALIGGGGHEACAGPPRLIRRTSGVFLGVDQPVEHSRVACALALAGQVVVGASLGSIDGIAEAVMLRAMDGRVTPANRFIGEQLRLRLKDLPDGDPMALPWDIANEADALLHGTGLSFGLALSDVTVWALQEQILEALRVERPTAVALHPSAPDVQYEIGLQLAQVLGMRVEAARTLRLLEQTARAALGLVAAERFEPGPLVFPKARSALWFQSLAGYYVSHSLPPQERLSLGTPGRPEGTRQLSLPPVQPRTRLVSS